MRTVVYFDSPLSDEQAAMADRHFALARKAAHCNRDHLSHEDALDAAVDGLLRAAHRYDPSKGVREGTWVVGNVKWAIWERVKWYRRHPRELTVLNEPVAGQAEWSAEEYADILPGKGPGPADHLLYGEFEDAVKDARCALPARLRSVLELYQDDGLTLKEIGQVLGVSEPMVNRNRKQALRKLKEALHADGWI